MVLLDMKRVLDLNVLQAVTVIKTGISAAAVVLKVQAANLEREQERSNRLLPPQTNMAAGMTTMPAGPIYF